MTSRVSKGEAPRPAVLDEATRTAARLGLARFAGRLVSRPAAVGAASDGR